MAGASGALAVWTLFEVYKIYKAVTAERREIWELRYGKEVTVSQAIGSIVMQIAVFYTVINIIRIFMGEGCFFQWTVLTNMLMAAGPGILWQQRGSRKGSSIGLAIVILLGTINTFLPISMFVLALPTILNHFWYYITGVVFTCIAVNNLYMVLKLPAKEHFPGEKKPIW